jgi:hypothetical protein
MWHDLRHTMQHVTWRGTQCDIWHDVRNTTRLVAWRTEYNATCDVTYGTQRNMWLEVQNTIWYTINSFKNRVFDTIVNTKGAQQHRDRAMLRDCSIYVAVQGIHKRISVSEVDNKMYLSTYTGTTYTASSGNCQSFSSLPAVRFSRLLWDRWTSFQNGVAAGEGFLCAPFCGVQTCDYSAARVSCTV